MTETKYWFVSDRLGRQETFDDPGAAFLRACEIAGVDSAVDVTTKDGDAFAIVRRGVRHSIHVVTKV